MPAYTFFTRTQEPYSFLLERREWLAKRARIIYRDHACCCLCGKKASKDVILHVHHKHYIYGLDPWEYKDSELMTLCEDCHSDLHQNEEVPVYRLIDGNLVQIDYTPCSRCGGAGWFHEYKHIQGGICFRCHGAQYDELIEVVEEYANEHNIDINDIDDGFKALNQQSANGDVINDVEVRKSLSKDLFYVALKYDNGNIQTCCLDFSVIAKNGDHLDPTKLRYRKAVNKNGQEYTIIKGVTLRQ